MSSYHYICICDTLNAATTTLRSRFSIPKTTLSSLPSPPLPSPPLPSPPLPSPTFPSPPLPSPPLPSPPLPSCPSSLRGSNQPFQTHLQILSQISNRLSSSQTTTLINRKPLRNRQRFPHSNNSSLLT
jgi:hypothetical protein